MLLPINILPTLISFFIVFFFSLQVLVIYMYMYWDVWGRVGNRHCSIMLLLLSRSTCLTSVTWTERNHLWYQNVAVWRWHSSTTLPKGRWPSQFIKPRTSPVKRGVGPAIHKSGYSCSRPRNRDIRPRLRLGKTQCSMKTLSSTKFLKVWNCSSLIFIYLIFVKLIFFMDIDKNSGFIFHVFFNCYFFIIIKDLLEIITLSNELNYGFSKQRRPMTWGWESVCMAWRGCVVSAW